MIYLNTNKTKILILCLVTGQIISPENIVRYILMFKFDTVMSNPESAYKKSYKCGINYE